MNVLLMATHLQPGGISRYCLSLGAGLARLGHKVYLATSGGNWETYCDMAGIEHITIPIRTKSIFSLKIYQTISFLKKVVRDKEIDILHANTRVTQFSAVLLSKICKLPYITTFHGFYRPHFFRKVLPLAGVLSIAVSNAVKEHLIEDLKIKSSKIRVVYNGLDKSPVLSSEYLKKEEIGLKASDFVIGMIGRISKEKGHFLALNALSLLWKMEGYKTIKFVVLGYGKMRDEFVSELKQRGLTDNVRIINHSPEQALRLMDVMLMPSSKEGFGYAIIEAFFNKVPVIGYNVGGISEIIQDNVTGLIFNEYTAVSLSDKIKLLIDDNNLRDKLANAAVTRAKDFSADNMAKDTIKVYKETL